MSTKKSLDLAKLGYDLLDRKRNILVHEMMQLIDKASKIQQEIDETYSKAYLALQRANVTLGMCAEFAQAIPVDESLDIDLRSVMGVELPVVTLGDEKLDMYYGLNSTNSQLDEAYLELRAGQAHDRRARGDREQRISPRRCDKENAEASKRARQYHDSAVHRDD